ncbi:hypothetical protein FACS1894174_03530 [Bacteroidia bacterium]|nr:hypothetical protein FACS1894174_03530 [Bacteroidia bacterium]
MNSKEYIIEKLKNISNEIKNISLRYAYDITTDFHIIEVAPESVRRGNDDYMNMEHSFWSDFHKLFPNEDILISEKCETNDMSNLIYEILVSSELQEAVILPSFSTAQMYGKETIDYDMALGYGLAA